MMNLYYVVEIQLQDVGDIQETTGWKNITVYDIDTQTIQPTIVCEIEAKLDTLSEEEIQTWLDNNDYENKEFNFVKL